MMTEKHHPPTPGSTAPSGYHGSRRPELTCGVLYTCYGSLIDVEDWLDGHCQGAFSFAIDQIDEDLVKKTVRIMFELESDKALFISGYIQK